jgi:hypothetical protein
MAFTRPLPSLSPCAQISLSGTYNSTGVTTTNPVTIMGFSDGARNFPYDTVSYRGASDDTTGKLWGMSWAVGPNCVQGYNVLGPQYGSTPYIWVQGFAGADQGRCSDTFALNCAVGYALRPCTGADTWGGVGTSMCSTHPTQAVTMAFGG